MWSMWFNYYMHANKLYTVFSNLGTFTGKLQSSLIVNRHEPGLHYARKQWADVSRLLVVWKDDYIKFPVDIVRLNWDGSYVHDDRRY